MTNKEFIEERIRLIDEAIEYKKSFIHDRSDNEGVKRLLEQKTQFESIKKDLEMIELLKKCYYASSIEKTKTLHLTSYGFDNPLDVIKIGEWLDEK